MAMRCPICDAKLESGQVCKYCGVTRDEIINGSNKKVKEYKKTDREDLVYFTNIIPKDVSRVKLIILTILLGWIGINHYYVKRVKRAIFSTVTTSLAFIVQILSFLIKFSRYTATQLFYEIIFTVMAINVIMWVWDIIAVLVKSFRIPIVLGEKEKN